MTEEEWLAPSGSVPRHAPGRRAGKRVRRPGPNGVLGDSLLLMLNSHPEPVSFVLPALESWREVGAARRHEPGWRLRRRLRRRSAVHAGRALPRPGQASRRRQLRGDAATVGRAARGGPQGSLYLPWSPGGLAPERRSSSRGRRPFGLRCSRSHVGRGLGHRWRRSARACLDGSTDVAFGSLVASETDWRPLRSAWLRLRRLRAGDRPAPPRSTARAQGRRRPRLAYRRPPRRARILAWPRT